MKKHNTTQIGNCQHTLTVIGYLDDGAMVNVCTDCGKRCLLSEKELKGWGDYSKEVERDKSKL